MRSVIYNSFFFFMCVTLPLSAQESSAEFFRNDREIWSQGKKIKKEVNYSTRQGGRVVLASWYGGGEKLNRHTATGERFYPHGLTAAHRRLPMGTRLSVQYRGKSVVVRINDRGPAKWTGRELDLSRGAALRLGMLQQGSGKVTYHIVN